MNGFEKTILNDIIGLSCIENYILYTLKQKAYNYAHLFYKNYLPFQRIVDEFVSNNGKYASFYCVERLQQTAKECGWINSEYAEASQFTTHLSEDDYLAVAVKPWYIKQKYNTALWRGDHFILLKRLDNENYYYLNDIPRDSGVISVGTVEKIYADAYFLFSLNEVDECAERERHGLYAKSFVDSLESEKGCTDKNLSVENVEMLRDIFGILKILRRRIHAYCGNYMDVSFMEEYLAYLDKTYASIEYIRLRKTFSPEKAAELLSVAKNKDVEIIGLVRSEMEKWMNAGK